jgi:hypothetical protein
MGRIAWQHAPDTGNADLTAFLDALLDAVQTLNRDGILGLSPVTQTAGPLYTVNEQQMLNSLKELANGLKGNL